MSNLTILNTAIRQFDNLYNLNDLHRVGGNASKHQPFNFIRLDTTQELVAEIQKEDPNTPAVVRKNGIGTYACEEIALAYAMWISPKFHLVVLRAFIAMHKGQSQNTQPNLPLAEPEPKPDVVIPYEDAEFIADYIVKVRVFAKEVELFHRKLYENLGIQRGIRNNLAAQGYDIAHEFNYWLDPFVDRVLPKTKPNKPYLIYNC